jgi:hypothetical protein
MGRHKLKPARRSAAPRVVTPSLQAMVERQAVQIDTLREAVRRQIEALDAIALAAPSSDASMEIPDSTLHHAQTALVRSIGAIRQALGLPAADLAAVLPERAIDIEGFLRTKPRKGGYDRMRDQMSAAIRHVGAHVAPSLVISRGDQTLLDATGPHGRHFPQNDDGVYAGYHPASSAQAIRHLEALRAKGAGFLVIPATAAWWLDYYGEFRRHLDTRYRVVFAAPDQCAIYDVRTDGSTERDSHDQRT